MFEGFALATIDTGETTIRVRHGGNGPPLLLLHGIPQTHLMWHLVAPKLARDFTVVTTDIRGYGDSGKPPTMPDHEPYSKRAMARDQIDVMRQLGFERFGVAGHDRGGRVAYRLALDHPQRVRKLAQPEPLPERLVGADPQQFVDHLLDAWSESPGTFPDEVRAAYHRSFRNPETIHAVCEEYRAAATLDDEHDEADRGRRHIACPVLALWSGRGVLPTWYGDVLALWRGWADDVRGRALDCGHFLAEEAPDET